ncbi:hypothetical protein MBANPS3_012412 [Mucor bainieri]
MVPTVAKDKTTTVFKSKTKKIKRSDNLDMEKAIKKVAKDIQKRIKKELKQQIKDQYQKVKALLQKHQASQTPAPTVEHLAHPHNNANAILAQRGGALHDWLHAKPSFTKDEYNSWTVKNSMKKELLAIEKESFAAENLEQAYKQLDSICLDAVKTMAATFNCEDHLLPNYSSLNSQLLKNNVIISTNEAMNSNSHLNKFLRDCQDSWPVNSLVQLTREAEKLANNTLQQPQPEPQPQPQQRQQQHQHQLQEQLTATAIPFYE